MHASGRYTRRTAQVRSRMRGRGASWAYPNSQVKGCGGGRQGAGRAEASMRSTSAALCCGFTEAGRARTQQAARRRPGSARRRQPGWPSEGPARGIALRIGVHAAHARSARAEWACACGQPGLMVAYFPSRCCGDNHTVFGLLLCAQVHRCISLHQSQGHSVFVHLPTQG